MKTVFDNQAFLNSLSPNLDQLNKLSAQRNWAIGIGTILLISTGYFAIIAINRKKDLTAFKNEKT